MSRASRSLTASDTRPIQARSVPCGQDSFGGGSRIERCFQPCQQRAASSWESCGMLDGGMVPVCTFAHFSQTSLQHRVATSIRPASGPQS